MVNISLTQQKGKFYKDEYSIHLIILKKTWKSQPNTTTVPKVIPENSLNERDLDPDIFTENHLGQVIKMQ